MAYQSINFAIESSIVNYLSSSYWTDGTFLNQLQQSGSIVNFYQGINNTPMHESSSIVYVSCGNANEIVFNSRVCEMNVTVAVEEIAADTSILGQTPEYIFNEFVNSVTASANFTNNVICVYQVQIQGFDQHIVEDTIQSIGNFRIVGGLKGSPN